MRREFITKEPVLLDGYQAVLKPSKFGYSLSALIGEELVGGLTEDRKVALEWAEERLKDKRRSCLKPEPWEEVSEGSYKIKFSWNEQTKPAIMDSSLEEITNQELPLFSGSKVKLMFYQRPYLLKDGITYGTSLKLLGVQVVSLSINLDAERKEPDFASVAKEFGVSEGFRQAAVNS
ncbi:single-stranded DNA-binding protein [Synechococcus sp. AH-601-P06]|nr:single-stranded DNA-binding protein [Synechococcus sp. AH-601-P06]